MPISQSRPCLTVRKKEHKRFHDTRHNDTKQNDVQHNNKNLTYPCMDAMAVYVCMPVCLLLRKSSITFDGMKESL